MFPRPPGPPVGGRPRPTWTTRWGRAAIRAIALGLVFASAPTALGCAGRSSGPAIHAGSLASHESLRGERFDAAFSEWLGGEASQEARLGLARALIEEAGALFQAGAQETGRLRVESAFLWLEGADDPKDLIDAATAPPLRMAEERQSARGDVSRATFMMELLRPTQDAAGKRATDLALATAFGFERDTESRDALVRAHESQLRAADRALLDPTYAAKAAAQMGELIDLGIAENQAFRRSGQKPTPERIAVVIRAVDAGAATVLALLLRAESLEVAFDSAQKESARRVFDPELARSFAAALRHPTGPHLRALFAEFVAQTKDRVGTEVGLAAPLDRAARLRLLVLSVRADPSHVETAVLLSELFIEMGLADLSPLVLQGAAAGATPREGTRLLRSYGRALSAWEAIDDATGRLRTIGRGARLVKAIESGSGPPDGKALAEVLRQMARLSPEPASALGLLARAEAYDPAVASSIALGRGFLSAGDAQGARRALEEAAPLAKNDVDTLDIQLAQIEVLEVSSEWERASGLRAQALAMSPQVSTLRERVRLHAARAELLSDGRRWPEATREWLVALEAAKGDGPLFGWVVTEAAAAAWLADDREFGDEVLAFASRTRSVSELRKAILLVGAIASRGRADNELLLELAEGRSTESAHARALLGKGPPPPGSRPGSARGAAEARFYQYVKSRAFPEGISAFSVVGLLEARLVQSLARKTARP